MKITIGSISLDIRQILRFLLRLIGLCVPATVFIGVCTGIFLAFDGVLLMLDQSAPGFIGYAWLSLLIFFIVLGVVFVSLVARLIRHYFGSEELRVQRRMGALTGLPFYVLCLLFFVDGIALFFLADANTPAAAGAISVGGFLLFLLTSGAYLLLIRFFLRPSAQRERNGIEVA